MTTIFIEFVRATMAKRCAVIGSKTQLFHSQRQLTISVITSTTIILVILIFLEKISLSNRLLNIDKVLLQKGSEKQRGRYEMVSGTVSIISYRYNPKFTEIKPIEEVSLDADEENTKAGAKKKKGKR
jgi:hypothetical protein